MPLDGSETTQLRPEGTPGLPYGSFAGKVPGSKSYDEDFTQHAVYGGIAMPYGSFAGKVPGSKSYDEDFTQHAVYGGIAMPYGSFAGKTAATPAPPLENLGGAGRPWPRRRPRRVNDEEALLLALAVACEMIH